MIKIQNTLHRGYIILSKINETVSDESIQEFVKITSLLERRNYILTKELADALLHSDAKLISKLYKDIRKSILLPKGKTLRPVFATKDISDEYFTTEDAIRQIDVYFQTYGLGNIYETTSEERKVESEEVTIDEKIKDNNLLKIIDIKTVEEFKEDLRSVISMPIVFGEEQLTLLNDAHKNNLLVDLLDTDIKVKENLFAILELVGSANVKKLNLFKTANDVLRYALFVSQQDWRGMSLFTSMTYEGKTTGKFNISTAERKVIMSALNKIDTEFAYNDMRPRKSLWLGLGMNIHPRSKKFSEYGNAQQLFTYLREGNVPFKTYHQLTDTFIRTKDFKGLFDHLKVNSGYLMRSILMMVRNSSDTDFEYIVKEISNVNLNIKLVMQIKSLIKYQIENDIINRTFKIKGKIVPVDDKPLYKLNEDRGNKVIKALDSIMMNGLKGKELISGKKVFIDDVLKRYILPSEVRNLSVASSGVIYTPGTRIPLPEDLSFVRLFTAWGGKDGSLGFDIDLSASFMKDGKIDEVAFYNQSNDVATHSGDFTSCLKWSEKEVTAEFIDIDFQKAVEDNIEYMLTSQFIFSAGHSVNDYDTDINTYSGVQLLSKKRAERTKSIDISDSILKLKIAGKYQSHMPLAIDFKTKEIVIIDMYSEEKSGRGAYSIRNSLDTFKREYFEAINMKTNMFDFLTLFLTANNIEIVNSIEDADTVMGYNDIKLEDEKEFFNISNNLERIVGLLN